MLRRNFFTIFIFLSLPQFDAVAKDFNQFFAANGFINFTASFNDQNKISNQYDQKYFIGNDSQIYLKAHRQIKEDTTFGAVAKVEFNYNSAQKNEIPNLDQTFFYAENNFGKFEFGNNKAVNQMMKTGPARFARGAGGINGKYLEQVNFAMLTGDADSSSKVCNGSATDVACANIKLPRFIVLAQSPIGHGGNAKGFNNYQAQSDYYGFNRSRFRALKDDSFDGFEDATKLNYYTPRFYDIKLGISYTPTTASQGFTANNMQDLDLIRYDNVISFGANYSSSINNVGISFSLTAEEGQIKNLQAGAPQRGKLFAYDVGAALSYFGFTIGASYGSWGNSAQPKTGIYSCNYNSNLLLASQTCQVDTSHYSNPNYYTLGIAYEFGPIGASITSINSNFQKNNYQAIAFDLDYKYTKYLMPYIEITRFAFKSNQPMASNIVNQNSLSNSQRQLKDNSGFVFLTGILFSF